MHDPGTDNGSAGNLEGIRVGLPRWGIVKGIATGAVIEVPAIAGAVWLLARVGVGNRAEPYIADLRLTAVFAGIAALVTAAGLGRLAAVASLEGGRRRAMVVTARAHAAASAALVLISAIPHGELPDHALGYVPFLLGGAVCGAVCGAVIGAVCGGAAPVGISDVVALARRPSEALRQFLDPEDLVKLGTALRDRTSNLLSGMFEPGPKPPSDGDDQPKPPDKSGERPTRSAADGGAKVNDKAKPP